MERYLPNRAGVTATMLLLLGSAGLGLVRGGHVAEFTSALSDTRNAVANYAGFCPIVRVADLQYALVARALDCGAQGIIFPRVESSELLEKAVSWTKFPPAGIRGYGLGAWQVDYEPLKFPEIIAHANANNMVVLQIETRRALDAREELLAVPGVDTHDPLLPAELVPAGWNGDGLAGKTLLGPRAAHRDHFIGEIYRDRRGAGIV